MIGWGPREGLRERSRVSKKSNASLINDYIIVLSFLVTPNMFTGEIIINKFQQ